MERLKYVITIVSLVFIILCLAGSAWMYFGLPDDDPNRFWFGMSAIIFLFAALWYGVNAWNLKPPPSSPK